MAASPSIALHQEHDGEHFVFLLCMAISDKETERGSSLQMCRDNEKGCLKGFVWEVKAPGDGLLE